MLNSSLYGLRPLTGGHVIDRAVRLYRHEFWPCVMIAAAIEIPLTLSRLFYRTPGLDSYSNTNTVVEAMGYGMVGLVAYMTVRLIAAAAMSQVVVLTMQGNKVSFAAAYKRLLVRGWAIALTILTLIPTTLLMVAWYFIPCIGSLSGIGLNAFYFGVLLPLSVPIVMIEQQRGLAVLRRAWDLTRVHFWASVGFSLYLLLFLFCVWAGPRLLVQIIFVAIFDNDPASLYFYEFFLPLPGFQGYLTPNDLVGMIFNILIWPVAMIALTLRYVDLRVRNEGLDLFLWADAQLPDVLRAEPEKVLAQTPPAPGGTWMSSVELVRFVGLTILVGGSLLRK
jgi:hypothetical protein